MRFIVDQPVSWHIARDLAAAGHDAIHVRDLGMAASPDPPILERAESDDRIIITQDVDYGTLLILGKRTRPSVIRSRMRDGRPSTQIRLLRQHLPELEIDLRSGAIVLFDDASIRVRRLS